MTNNDTAQEILDSIAKKMEHIFETTDKTYSADFWDVWEMAVKDLGIKDIYDEEITVNGETFRYNVEDMPFKFYITGNVLDEVVEKIKLWNPETQGVNVLLDLCNELDKVKHESGIALEDYYDITQFPVAQKYQDPVNKYAEYPIWACDFEGDCMTGEGKFEIETLKSIVEWYTENEG